MLFNLSIFTTTIVSIKIVKGSPAFLFRSDFKDETESTSSTCDAIDRVECIIVMLFGLLVNPGNDPFAKTTSFESAVMEIVL